MKLGRIKDKQGFCFLLLIFLIGMCTVFSYGFYLDETTEQNILFSNLYEYARLLPGESGGWTQELDAEGILPISIAVDRDHGSAVYYPAGIVWKINQISPYLGSVFWHAYTFLLIFWGMCCLYGLGKLLFQNKRIAALMTALFFLTPRMFAEMHYNNKDVVLLALHFVMFYWGLRLLRELSVKSILMLALAGALATNMKIIGAWSFGVIGLYVLIYYVGTGRFQKQVQGKALLCIGLWTALYILLTPACWGNMIEFFEYLYTYAVDYSRWKDYVLFNGKMLHHDYTGTPRKYLPIMLLYTLPVGILLLMVAGGLLLVGSFFKTRGKSLLESEGYILAITVTGMIPFMFAVLSGTHLYNGWRHFYFIYAFMIVIAGYALHRINACCAAGAKQKCFYGLTGAYVAVLALGIAINHPQQHSYYNFLAGDDVVERYELDYWDMSVKQAYESILKDAKDKTYVTVSAVNLPTMWGLNGQYKVLPLEKRERIQVTEQWEDADYIIINTTYAVMYSRESYEQIKQEWQLVEQISSYGNVICEVYREQ